MIYDFRKFSLVDYPRRGASVVFFGGCNYRCPFCYNLDLVLPEFLQKLRPLSEAEILEELKRREKYVSAVVLTGGEPTIHGDRLRSLCQVLKELDLLVKLDTNGSNPALVEELVNDGCIDYLAVDVKTSPAYYRDCGGEFPPVARTIGLLKQRKVDGEVRITVTSLLTPKRVYALVPFLKGVPRIVLQRMLGGVPMINPEKVSPPYGEEEFRRIAEAFWKKGLLPMVR